MPSKKEQRLAELRAELEELEAEPDPAPVGRSVATQVTIDLSDPVQVKRGIAMGLLEKGDLDEFDDPPEGGDGEDAPDAEDPPRRRARYD